MVQVKHNSCHVVYRTAKFGCHDVHRRTQPWRTLAYKGNTLENGWLNFTWFYLHRAMQNYEYWLNEKVINIVLVKPFQIEDNRVEFKFEYGDVTYSVPRVMLIFFHSPVRYVRARSYRVPVLWRNRVNYQNNLSSTSFRFIIVSLFCGRN